MNRLICCILISLFVLSCNNIDRPKKPDNLISKNKMIDIITDINLVTAAKGIDKKLLEKKGLNQQSYIYQKYDIDSISFAESNNYYAYDVKEYEDIYLKVQQRLEKQKQEFKAIEEKEKKEKDSIRLSKKKERDSIKKSKNSKVKLLQDSRPANLLKKDRKSQ